LTLTDGSDNGQHTQVSSRMVANNGDFLRDMAVAGHGIIVQPTFIVWQSLISGDLVPIMESFVPPPLSAWVVYPQTRYLSRRARLLIEFLVERFGEKPYWDDAIARSRV
jgi:DNA-binding transcriptional LysR family regulator